MNIARSGTTRSDSRGLRGWCGDVLKQLFWGAVIYLVVASFANEDKVGQHETTMAKAASTQRLR